MKPIPKLHALPVEVAASAFAALGSEQRLTVLRTLVRAGPDGLSIGALGEKTGITGSTLTHHMRILTQAGLATQAKQGRSVICAAADYAEVRALSEFLLSECCAEQPAPQRTHDHG
jgi:ArsR family transcriptional regulator